MCDFTGLTEEASSLYNLLLLVRQHGLEVSPRGQLVKELTNLDWTFPPMCRWMNFAARKLNIDYVRAELRWYLRADPLDHSICDYASKWGELVQPDGALLSNYGYYLFGADRFGQGYNKMAVTLVKDPDTRQAVCPILSREHLYPENPDVPCTMYVGFMIRNDRLMMNVRMRSQDAIWGLGNDLPFFSVLHELMWLSVLRHRLVSLGGLNLRVDSFHLYERHFKMVEAIIQDPQYEPVSVPRITSLEGANLVFRDLNPVNGAFTRWLQYG